MNLRQKEHNLLHFCRKCHGPIDSNGKGEDIEIGDHEVWHYYDPDTITSHKTKLLHTCLGCGRKKVRHYTKIHKVKYKDIIGIEGVHPACINRAEAERGWSYRNRL